MTDLKDRSWPTYLLFVFGGVVIAYVFGGIASTIYPNSTDLIHRTAGGTLQLLGVGTVALGISQLRRMFGLENTFVEMASEWVAYLKDLWWRIARVFGQERAVNVSVATSDITLSPATARSHGTASARPDASLEERIRVLEVQYAKISQGIFDLEGKLQEEVKKRSDALRAERQARETAFGDLQRTLRALATGGIRLQIVGVMWFLFGIFLATWAPEIASFI